MSPLGPVEVCRMAIIAYFRAHYRYIKFPFYEEAFTRRANTEAQYLVDNGDEGLRYGDQTGWPNTWLVYRDGVFLLLGGADDEKFMEFKQMVREEFEAVGLELH